MTLRKLRELIALGKRIGATLQLKCSGHMLVEFNEPDTPQGRGGVTLWHHVEFVGEANPDGEGWEFYSSRDGRSLRAPQFISEDGEVFSVEEAMKRDSLDWTADDQELLDASMADLDSSTGD